MSKIIAIGNQKGGVGKTTTAVNMAAALAKRGKKVLGIDLDPQFNMSEYLGYEYNTIYSICDLMIATANNELSDEVIAQCIVHNDEGIDYIPSNIKLASADLFLSNVMCREQILKRILKRKIFDQYDVILIDCLPSLGILLTNALAAADGLIIPVQAQKFALDGLRQLEQVYQMVKLNVNPELNIEGVILTMYDNTNMSKAVEAELEAKYGSTLYVTRIHKRIEAPNSTYVQKSLVSYENSVLGAEYIRVTDEFIERSLV